MSKVQSKPKLQVTKNYRLFDRSPENRQLNRKKHKKLLVSMQRYGFLPSFPLSCERNGARPLLVKDGQHRLVFAEELHLPVYYVVDGTEFDIAQVNCAAKTWVPRDYAEKYAANKKRDYVLGLQFADSYGLPVATAFALLAGTVSYTNIQAQFVGGKFQVKDSDWAHQVAALYQYLISVASDVRNKRCLEACMCVCRVPSLKIERLTRGAKRCRHKLLSYSTRDAYLDMLEEIYNYGRKQLVALKNESIMAMRDRSAIPTSL